MTELPDVLERIVARRRVRLTGPPEAPSRSVAGEGTFLDALRSGGPGHRVIAEVKMGSPRLGSLAGRIDGERQAALYAANGAAALSVVVEPDGFFGSYDLLAECRRASGLPTLAKDFVLDERQLDWAGEAGADAVLLLAALHGDERLLELGEAARARGLTPLVETHGEREVERVAGQGWELVGINNRDLRTFDVDLRRSAAWVGGLPASAVKVAESGLSRCEQLATLAAAGFDAFLVGETLLLADDPATTLRELVAGGSR